MGVAIFQKKTPEATWAGNPRCYGPATPPPRPGLPGLAWPAWPQVGPILKIRNRLIGPLAAPNDVPISSPSGKFPVGAEYGPTRASEKIKKFGPGHGPGPGPRKNLEK